MPAHQMISGAGIVSKRAYQIFARKRSRPEVPAARSSHMCGSSYAINTGSKDDNATTANTQAILIAITCGSQVASSQAGPCNAGGNQSLVSAAIRATAQSAAVAHTTYTADENAQSVSRTSRVSCAATTDGSLRSSVRAVQTADRVADCSRLAYSISELRQRAFKR